MARPKPFDRRGRVIQLGNAPHVKTDRVAQQVERLVFCGLDVSEISYCLGLSVATLKEQYADELENGTSTLIGKVGSSVVKAALRGDMNAAQFLLRARGRWVTPTKQEIDANVTVTDKRKTMDEIMSMMLQMRQRADKPVIDMTKLIAAKPEGTA